MNIKGQSFLKLLDFTPEQITDFLTLAADLERQRKRPASPIACARGSRPRSFSKKTSTRTRCSFEVAAHDLGMTVTYLDPSGSQIGKRSRSLTPPASSAGCTTASSTAATASRSSRSWQIRRRARLERPDERVPPHTDPRGLPDHSGALQALQGKKLVYMGDARCNNNVPHGRLRRWACTSLPTRRRHSDAALIETCQKIAAGTGATLEFDTDPMSRGPEHGRHLYRRLGLHGRAGRGLADAHPRSAALSVNAKLMAQAGPQCRFMHRLPAFPRPRHHHRQADQRKIRPDRHGGHRRSLRKPQSIVFDEAEKPHAHHQSRLAATLA